MKAEFFDKLKDYSQKAIKVTKKYFNLDDLNFDHICYQTVSKDDYRAALKQLEEDIEIIAEIPHAGRMLTIAKLKNKIVVDGVDIDRIEISEPKPKRIVKSRSFDHFSFFVKGDFEHAIEKLREQGVKISEMKQIGSHKFIKFIGANVEIELRNKRLGDDIDGSLLDKDLHGSRQDLGHLDDLKKEKGSLLTKDENNGVELKDDFLKLKRQFEEEREGRLRALADYQNLKKRVEEEQKNFISITNAVILGELLDILDDLDRAIKNMKVEEKEQVGIRIVRDKLKKIIDTNGLVEIKYKVGDTLDPDFCEAVGIVAVEDKETDNTIREIVQKGYKVKDGDRVVRPLRVIVGKKSV